MGDICDTDRVQGDPCVSCLPGNLMLGLVTVAAQDTVFRRGLQALSRYRWTKDHSVY